MLANACHSTNMDWVVSSLSNVVDEGLLTEGFFSIPSLAGPTTIAARQSGGGISWMFPFISLLYLPFAFVNVLTARLNDGVPLVDESLILFGFYLYTGVSYSLSHVGRRGIGANSYNLLRHYTCKV